MPESLSLPNLLVRILADNEQVKAKMSETNALMAKSMAQMNSSVQAFTKRGTQHMNQMTESWWKKFGRIALGFTVAYRAINAFEAGVRRMTRVISEAIKESGELATLQAKLAFYYVMFSKDVVSFSDAFKDAAVNVRELQKAALGSLSTLEELSIGYDEIAQSIGGLGKESIRQMTALVDFTVMVAQTTGSTTRQIRQEIQALLQGQVRTTDIAIRTLKRMGVLTDEDIAKLRSMTNTAQILDKVLGALYDRMEELREIAIRSNIDIAIQKWDDTIKMVIRDAVTMASNLDGVYNIFAEIFYQRMKGIRESMSIDDWRNMIRLMQILRNVLAFLADAFLVVIKSLGQLAIWIEAATRQIGHLIPALKGVAIALVVWNSLKLVASLFKLLAGGLILKTAKSFIYIGRAIAGVGAASLVLSVRLGFMTLLIGGVALAFASLLASLKNVQKLMTSFSKQLKIVKEADLFKGEHGIVKWIKEIITALSLSSKEVVGDKGFFDLLKEQFSEGAKMLGKPIKAIFDAILQPIKDSFKDVADLSDEQIKKLLDDLEKAGKGLGTPGALGVDIYDSKAVDNYQRSLQKLLDTLEISTKTFAALKSNQIDWKDTLGIKHFQDMIEIEQEYKDLIIEIGIVRAELWKEVAIETLNAKEALEQYMDQLRLSYDVTKDIYELTHSFRKGEIFELNREVEAMRIIANTNKELLAEIDTYRKARLAEIEAEYSGLAELSRSVAKEMENAFSDLFFDVMSGNFEDLGDLAERTFRGMQRALADYLALQARIAFVGEEGAGGSFFGGLWEKLFGGSTATASFPSSPGGIGGVYHEGGRVGYWGGVQSALSAMAPRLHDGLKSDEMFAILQRGERVYKRGDMPFDKVEIHNYTPFEAKSEEKDTAGGGKTVAVTIGEMMGSDIMAGGPLHTALRKRFGLKPSVRGR